jgi:SRSO17 transposase
VTSPDLTSRARASRRRRTPGVQRQYLGCVGKIANGIVTVHLGVCKGRYKTLFDAELFLSEEWAADKERRQQAGIPEDMVYRPKWQIALEEVDRAVAHKVVFDWLTFDEEYGKAPQFVTGLEDRQLRFVGEVSKILSCLAAAKSPSRPAAAVKDRPAQEVVQSAPAFLKQRCHKVKLLQQTGGRAVWEVKAAPVWQVQDGQWSQRTYWLIWAKNVATGEEKYFLSNASADAKVERLVRVAFRRWHVELDFRCRQVVRRPEPLRLLEVLQERRGRHPALRRRHTVAVRAAAAVAKDDCAKQRV